MSAALTGSAPAGTKPSGRAPERTPPNLQDLRDRTDEQLMLGCRGAPPERARLLVGELARRYLERLAGFIYGVTGDSAGSVDLAQEAFIRVFRHRENYKEMARFSTWLYTIGRNLALNELRDRRRRPLTGQGGEDDGQGAGDAVGLGHVPATGDAPDVAAERADVASLVRREIGELPDHYRVVIILCDLEERPYAEAAEILEVPIGTIRSRLSRARDQLERRLRKVLA